MKCCLCNKEIIGNGNNAEPLKKGRCCDDCNKLVILARFKSIFEKRKK